MLLVTVAAKDCCNDSLLQHDMHTLCHHVTCALGMSCRQQMTPGMLCACCVVVHIECIAVRVSLLKPHSW